MHSVTQLCLATNNIVLMMRKCDCSFMKVADHFMYQRYSLKKQTHDRMIKTIIIINSVIAKYSDLSVSYRSINILSQTLASSTNHNILLNLIQLLNIGQRKISQKIKFLVKSYELNTTMQKFH